MNLEEVKDQEVDLLMYKEIKKYCQENTNFVYFQNSKEIKILNMISNENNTISYYILFKSEEFPKILKIKKKLDLPSILTFLNEIEIMRKNPEFFINIVGVYCEEFFLNSKNNR